MHSFWDQSSKYTGGVAQAYTHKQAQHLVEIEDDPDSPALASLQRWSLEITAVFTCLSVTNPRVMDVLSVSSMDTELQSEPHPDNFYDDLLVSLCSASVTHFVKSAVFVYCDSPFPLADCIYKLSVQGIYNMSTHMTLLHF